MQKQCVSLLFFSLLIAGFCQQSMAQISIGFRGGLSLNNLNKSPLEENEPNFSNSTGFQFAIPIEIGINDYFAIQPELMFSTHGGIQEANSSSQFFNLKTQSYYKANYLVTAFEIPVLAKLTLGNDPFQFYAMAGPSFGLNTKGQIKQNANVKITDTNTGNVVTDESSSETFKAKFLSDNYNSDELGDQEFAVSKTNLNLHMGAGLGVNLGGVRIFLDARYMLGLSDFSPESNTIPKPAEVSFKSDRIGVSVGAMFSLN